MKDPWTRRDTRVVTAIALVAFALRIVLVAMTTVIGADSPAYLHSASEMTQGVWAVALTHGLHPGYPSVIVAVGALCGDLEAGGYLASAVLSSLAVVPFFALARDVAGRRAAVLASLLCACLTQFIRVHADVMTEGTFHFFFASAASLAWFAATRVRLPLYLLAGVAGAGAYLTRPEGIYMVAAIPGVTLLALGAARLRGERPAWRALAFATASLVVLLVLIYPLLRWFRDATGAWTITNRVSASLTQRAWRDVEVEAGHEAALSEEKGWVSALGRYGYRTWQVCNGILAPLMVAGIFLARRRMVGAGAVYLLCLSAGYAFAPLVAASQGYPVSRRYVLVTVLFLLPFAAVSCVELFDQACRRWNRRRVGIIAATAVGLLLAAFSLMAIHPRRDREASVREAGLWLRTRVTPSTVVHGNAPRLGWYLGRRLPGMVKAADQLGGFLKAGEIAMVIEEELQRDVPGGLEAMERSYRRMARFPEGDSKGADHVSIFIAGSP